MKVNHRIVIVDDDADDREIIRDAFGSSAGEAEFVFVENGDKLMEYLEAHANNNLPSLILLDLNMPGKDGRDTLRDIKTNKQYLQVPTIVFTTSSTYRDRIMAYDLGANCFITKPDTFNKLVDLAGCITRLWLQ
jgi:CheY-like chemotaxis protein